MEDNGNGIDDHAAAAVFGEVSGFCLERFPGVAHLRNGFRVPRTKAFMCVLLSAKMGDMLCMNCDEGKSQNAV